MTPEEVEDADYRARYLADQSGHVRNSTKWLDAYRFELVRELGFEVDPPRPGPGTILRNIKRSPITTPWDVGLVLADGKVAVAMVGGVSTFYDWSEIQDYDVEAPKEKP